MYREQLCPAASLVLFAALLAAGCDSAPTAPDVSTPDGASVSLGRANGTVTVPFNAHFFTDLAGLLPDESCGPPPAFLNIQEGHGEATHLGRFSIHVSFCVDATDILDGELTEGESIPTWNGAGTLTAANGDELFITVAGTVFPSNHPDFDFEFSDLFHFVGGTGRFSGATGGGVASGLVDFQSTPSRTQHEWSGTLTLPRGK